MTDIFLAQLVIMQLMSVLPRQILLTLSYSNIFSKPLTEEEIGQRLLAPTSKTVPRLLAKGGALAVGKALAALRQLGLVRKTGQFWQLASISADLAKVRKRREVFSQAKLNELQPFLDFCRRIPWIAGVAVTGSVSVMNAEAKDDTDLMVVVQRERLWLVRPILVLFSFLKGKRRSWNHEEENSWCLNLWLEETELAIQPDRWGVYLAYEVVQAKWLLATGGIDQRFLKKNIWIKHYLPNFPPAQYQLDTTASEGINWATKLITQVNNGAYYLQRWYMQPHITREKVSLQAAFFHPRDTISWINSRWQKLLKKLS